MTEGTTAAAPADAADVSGFQPPPEVPWSELGPEFVQAWGRTEEGKTEGQHVEITGQSGSGKSYAEAAVLHMRALARDTPTVIIATKLDDATVERLVKLGWPRVKTADEVRRHRQCVFWPDPQGDAEEREIALERAIYELLSLLWVSESNTVVVFDEIGTVEQLPGPKGRAKRLQKTIRQYWREGRALGISVVASKQRPVGVVRDQHSESRWKFVFPPADEGDMQRFAELLGQPRDWEPVLRSLDQEAHQFVIRNNVSKDAYISWIDFRLESLRPLPRTEEHPLYPGRNAQ
jgi:hypothetical protein